MEHSLLDSSIIISVMDFISGQLLTNPIYNIPGQYVNKSGKRLFCDRARSIHVFLYVTVS